MSVNSKGNHPYLPLKLSRLKSLLAGKNRSFLGVEIGLQRR